MLHLSILQDCLGLNEIFDKVGLLSQKHDCINTLEKLRICKKVICKNKNLA